MGKTKLSHPIFYDPAGRRRRIVRQVGFVFAVVVSGLASIFIASVLVNPWLPRLSLRQIASLPNANDMRLQTPSIVTPRGQKARRTQAALRRAMAWRQAGPANRQAMTGFGPAADQAAPRPLAIGFYVNWDDSSYQSLKLGLASLDWVVPEWIRLQIGDHPVVGEIDPRALDLIRRAKPNTPIIPMINNSREGKWDTPALLQAVGDEMKRRQIIIALANVAESKRVQGVCFDFEEAPTAAQPDLLRFMQELHEAFQPCGWIVTQAVPCDDSDWDYRAYAAANDYLMLMAYDEHWADSAPGSVAGEQWFEETLARRMSEIPGNRAIVCVGGYGYDWSPGSETAELTFQEAVLAARDSEAEINFDPVTRNPYFRYREEDDSQHTVWFLDAVTAFNQMRAAMKYQPAGFALWRLGSEDPSLWSVFGTDLMNADGDGLREIKYGYDVDFEGAGEILQVEAEPQAGSREVTVDPSTEMIAAEQYTKIPSSYVIRRGGDKPGLVALTFDDGPDPVWTPRVLDILKQAAVPASFFVIGQNGQANPDLVKRIVAEGHEIGNHSFTHPNLGEIPGRLTDLELNATQRLIESLTGRSTRLFRPPYFGDAEPTTSDEIEPVTRAERLGYLTVGLRVDSDDWTLPGANAIVERTIAGVTSPDPDLRGQVVLLHDGGGDRAQTVEALPDLIHELRGRGYRFVTVSELAGLTRDQAMPVVSPGSDFFPTADTMAFYTFAFGGWVLRWLFLIGIGLGLSRLFFIGALAFGQRLRARRDKVAPAGAPYQPFVSIIVPAYNEEKVIAQTIDSLLASTYQWFEIIVVDD